MSEFINKRLMVLNCLLGLILTTGCSGSHVLGIQNGKLAPCPGSPNCVCSCETDASHHVDPLTYKGNSEHARKKLLSVINEMPRTKIVSNENNYIHAEFKSKIFRFVDDVEFQFDDSAKIINVRSASRVGYSDLGVNRKRVEEIRRLFNEKMEKDADGNL